jgi:hypothetical protein
LLITIGREELMSNVDRRAMLGLVLGGVASAAMGIALIPDPAEAAPLMMSKGLDATTENRVEKAVVVVVPRRRRRRRCWWRGGRRVCGWR